MTGRKAEQNTNLETINTLIEPNTKTMVDRYVFASNFCKGKRVLDIACGYGYGMYILEGLGAKQVVGMDLDEEAVAFNIGRKRFEAWKEDVTYDWAKNVHTFDYGIPDDKKQCQTSYFLGNRNKFDVVVSVETFEHVPRETVPTMLKNFQYACKPGGKIIITTPRRKMPVWDYQGGTHCYEYSINEFVEEIQKIFGDRVELYFAHEFRHQLSPELNTIFTKDSEHANQCAVMVAVITNGE